MRNDKYGQQILEEIDLCNIYLSDPDKKIRNALTNSKIDFNSDLELNNIPSLQDYENLHLSIEDFDKLSQSKWFMPKEYIDFDIAKYVLDLCKSEAELLKLTLSSLNKGKVVGNE